MARDLPELDKECFYIAPIGADGSPERKRSDGVLKFIVGRAAEELDLVAIRADQLAEPGQITLQVIDHILGARAAVADLTGLNPNVFYELAVRHTARLPVALIADKECELPFDIAQMRTIFFDHRDLESADQCRQDIVMQLRKALDHGAVDSPIATSVDVRSMQAGNAVERNIAEVITTLENMSSLQRDTFRRIGYLEDYAHAAMKRNPSFAALDDDVIEHMMNVGQLIQDLADPALDAAFNRLEESVDLALKKIGRNLARLRPRSPVLPASRVGNNPFGVNPIKENESSQETSMRPSE